MAELIQRKQISRLLRYNPILEFGIRGNQTSSVFLRRWSNGDFSNLNPIRLIYDIEVFAVSAQNRLADTDGWTAEVYLNGVIDANFTTVVPAASSSVDNTLVTPVVISAGTQISARALITLSISRPVIMLYYQRVS